MAMETVTTTDKAVRDRMFNELRNSDNVLERQAVKFSGSEELIVDGKPSGKFVSNWSVAYPTS